MAFSGFKSLSETLKEFSVTYTEANFIEGVPFAVSDYFRQDRQLMLDDGVVDNSEYAICENLIYAGAQRRLEAVPSVVYSLEP